MSFPNSLFPGVYTRIIDTSFSIPSSGTSTAFTCFLSQKGPDNELVSLGSTSQLLSIFGNVNSGKYGQGMLILTRWFLGATNAYGLRVLPDETNLPCQNNLYNKTSGEYSPSKIKLKEASYSNLALGINNIGNVEVKNIKPGDYGVIKRQDPTKDELVNDFTTGYSNVVIGTRYLFLDVKNQAIQDKLTQAETEIRDAGGSIDAFLAFKSAVLEAYTGQGLNNFIVEKLTETDWTYFEPNDIGTAIIDNNEMMIILYQQDDGTQLSWESKEKIVDDEEELQQYVIVKDIIKTKPVSPVEGDIYLLSDNFQTPEWENYSGKVASYVKNDEGELNWEFSAPSKVLIDKTYYTIYEKPVTPTKDYYGKSYFMDPVKTLDAASKGKIYEVVAQETTTGTVYEWLELSIKINPSYSAEEKTAANVTLLDASNLYWEYTERAKVKTIVKTTVDLDADFPAYVHKVSEINAIIANSRPDLAQEEGHEFEPLFILYPIGRGAYYNNLEIAISYSANTEYLGAGDEVDYQKNLRVEVYDNESGTPSLMETFEVSLNPNARDEVNDVTLFIETVLNTHSNLIRCKAVEPGFLTYDSETGKQAYMKTINKQIDAYFTEYATDHKIGNVKHNPKMLGGSDGNLFNSKGDVDWTVANSLLAKAFMGSIKNPRSEDVLNPYETDVLDTEMVLIDLILDAGYAKGVKSAMLSLVEARNQDCMALIDLLDNSSAQAAYKARTDEGGIGKGFNTPYVAIYEPYSNVYDAYTGNDIWVSPIYHLARLYGLCDRDYGCWYAVAGCTRGVCSNVNKLRYNLYKESDYKDKFVNYNINPIVCNRDGYVVYGQSTSYLKQSKLRDINIVRTLLMIQRDLKMQLASMIFEFNDEDTYNAINNAVQSYLSDKVSQKVIESFQVSTYATDYDRQNHRCKVDVVIQPKYCIYQILLSLSV